MARQQSKIPHGWHISKLEDIATVFDGQHTTPKYINKGIPFYSAENVSGTEPCKFISLEEYKRNSKGNIPQKGDILITRIGSLCQSVVADWDGKFGIYVTLAAIQTKPAIVNNYFLNQFLKSDIYKREFFSKALLTAYPQKINMGDLRATSILLPSIKEQQKIVEVLACWDRGIETTKKLIAEKEKQKKALMQNLLTGKIRLKGFKDKWETKKIGDVCSIKKGEQLNATNLTEAGKYPCLNGGILPSGYTDNWNIERNTITISEGGNSCGYVNWNGYRFWAGGHCYVIYDVKISNKFLYAVLKFKEQTIMKLRVGSGLPNIQKPSLENLKLQIPSSSSEQEAIAWILSTSDKEINLLKQKLTKLQEQKEGLMQVLLTGQVRLKI